MMKRILCAGLCICMILSMIPTTVFAADGESEGVTEMSENAVYVTDAPYNAVGDGVANDRKAIQKAIDDMHDAGGGKVIFPKDTLFSSGNIILRSNVELHFEDGALLKQNTDKYEYVRPVGEGKYEYYIPLYGRNFTSVNYKYGHTWYHNYPFIYAGEGTENVKITGNGTIEMTRGEYDNGDDTICVCPIGFYRVKNFVVSDITITKYCTYAMMPYTCNDGLIKNVKINKAEFGSGDGISLMNSQNIRITECELVTNDDGIYIFSSYNDPRGGTWWSSENPQPSMNIEIDHNKGTVTWTDTKALGFILWGAGCPDQSLVEVKNIYIHDNEFNTMGIWDNHPYDTETFTAPVKNIRFENNIIGTVQNNFKGIPISDIYGYDCMKEMRNGDFEKTGEAYWVTVKNDDDASAGAAKDDVGQEGTWYGYIDKLDQGDAKLYQGIKLETNKPYVFRARVQSSGDTCRMFVRDQVTQEIIASKAFSNTSWEDVALTFEIPKTGNYQIGIERGNATKGWARIDSAEVEVYSLREQTIFTTQVPTDFDEVNTDAGKTAEYELGTRFSARKAGWINKVRMYTYVNESGKHSVSIWDYDNNEIVAGPYEWNVTKGIQGWQEFELPEPLYIQGNKSYVVSVSNGESLYYARGKSSDNGFATPIINGDLITYTDSGLFTTEMGTMPNKANKTVSYFRDVVFVPEQTVFTSQLPDDFDTELRNSYNLGMRFQSKMPGEIIKARMYTHENESGIHVVRIWDYATKTVIAGPYNWDVQTGTTGWQEFELPQPLKIEAGKDYMISITNGTKSYYARGKSTVNNFSAPIQSGDLITYVGSGYYSTDVNAMPNVSNRNYNYFRDIVFMPGELDRSELQSAIDEAKDLQRGDYTEETWVAFQDALTQANKTLSRPDNDVTQLDINEATTALNAASDALIVKIPESGIVFTDTNLVYDGTEKTPSVVVKNGNVVIAAEEYDVTYTDNVNAGTATATITAKDGSFYGIKTFEIGKAKITITVDDKEAFTGAAKPEFTYAVSGLCSNDVLLTEPTISCDCNMKTAGTFDIVASGADAGENYTIKYLSGTLILEVEPKGTWHLNSVGWWYENVDGSYACNCLQKIDGEYYYFNAAGYMVTGWQSIGGEWYFFNGSGAMVTGWLLDGNTWYYMNEVGVMLTGWQYIEGEWYFFNGSGAMLTGWLLSGSTWYYLDASGAMVTGLQVIGGEGYYFTEDGAMVTGWVQIGYDWYYFNGSGAMVTNQWVGNYYLLADGTMATNMWIGNYYVGADGAWVA